LPGHPHAQRWQQKLDINLSGSYLKPGIAKWVAWEDEIKLHYSKDE